ncbi:MAG: hypothetical protein JRJ65_03045 [Deltaproteobacteria bacterium]|nr:hypothetical protein [Deltaproteobacteria bacterium]
MGHGILVSCKKCDYSKEFKIGVREMYTSLEKVQKKLHYTRRTKVKEILDNHDIKDTDYAHELYHCSSCHSLYERFHIKIIYDDNQIYETAHSCTMCGKILVRIKQEEVPKLSCSRCGESALKADMAFDWD